MIGERQILSSRHSLGARFGFACLSFLRRRWTLVAAVAVVALCGYFGGRHFFGIEAGTAGPGAANGLQTPAPIPVTIGQAKTADFPVYLNGLGVVEPYQTVLVRSRVDGEVTKIAFKQGQMVKVGDVLVADRSAPVPGGARSGGCEEGARRGEFEQMRNSTWRAMPGSPRRISLRL